MVDSQEQRSLYVWVLKWKAAKEISLTYNNIAGTKVTSAFSHWYLHVVYYHAASLVCQAKYKSFP